jgi:phage terminase large subunit
MTKTIELDYCSRWQFEGSHDRKQRWAVLVSHRRAGKTVATVCDLIIRACEENKHDGRYAMVAPLYNQVKDNAWNYLKHYARPLLAEEPREAELSVLLVNGAKIRLYGADNPDRLRGGYFDGVVLDEFADMKSDVWRPVVRPMLSDRNGWATIIGTPKGKNEFWRVYQEAQKDPPPQTVRSDCQNWRRQNDESEQTIRPS